MSLQFRCSAVLVVLAVLLLTSCSLIKTKSDSGNSSSSSKDGSTSSTSRDRSSRGASFSPSSDARKDLHEALAKLNSAYPYRLTETMSSSANGVNAMPGGIRVVEFAAPDRSHMKWTGGQGEDVESISIGDKHYWFQNGKWTAGALPSRGSENRGAEFARKLAEMVKEINYLGPETINGEPCYAYSYTIDTTMAGQAYTGTGKVWIGAADGLPHQSDSEFKVANYGSKSRLVYEYNVNIKVEPPAM